MENRASTFGRSSSIPLFQQHVDDKNSRDNGIAVHDEQYRALQHSLGFQNYRDQAARVWSSNGNGFTSLLASAKGPTNDGCATDRSDSHRNGAVGSDTGMGDTSPIPDNSNSPNSETNGVTQPMKNLEKRLSGVALNNKLSANTTTSGSESRPEMDASVGFSNGISMNQEPKSPFSSSFAEGSGLPNQGHALHNDGWLSGLEHKAAITDTTPPKELYRPGGFAQHRRMNSRLSSLPGLPSPLGPQHYVVSLGTDLSGLVSPLPISPQQNTRWGKGAKKSVEFDLHALKVSANAVGSPYHRSPDKSFGFGHERNITDPFVDNADTGDKSYIPSPFCGAHASEDMSLPPAPQIQIPNTPTFQFPGPASAKLAQNNSGTPTYQGFASLSARPDFRVPTTPVFQPLPAAVPVSLSSQTFTNGNASRIDLPIPPPVLSSIQGKLNHTPETRRRLDAQAAIRTDWIRTEAAKIAELCRRTYAAGEKFKKTGTTEDYQMWQSLIAEYNDAMNQDKRQEERRNMCMPQGMKAMRTGAENFAGGHTASFDQGEAQGEGKLLGHQMAFMERVCAEVKRRKDEKEAQADEEDITPEMLGTLKKDEKKVLRQYLIDRLQTSVGGRET